MSDLTLASVLHPVTDLDKAKTVFGALVGAEPMADSPYYVGYDIGGVQLGLVPNAAAQGLTAPTAFWGTDDLEATVAGMESAGATVVQQPTDVGGGARTAKVTDTDGNTIGLIQK
jgi:predicted enzyme related to lactoylglutathione lyase